MFDREYAIYFNDEKMGGIQELGIDAQTLTEAKKSAKYYAKNGAIDVTIKYYEDGDIRHQWDLKNGKFIQYE